MTDIQWRESEDSTELTLFVDHVRRGAIVPWADTDSSVPTGYTGLYVDPEGAEIECAGKLFFWEPAESMQAIVLAKLGLGPFPSENASPTMADIPTPKQDGVSAAISSVESEVRRATALWPPFNSAHEGYGIIAEEFHELQEHVFTNQRKRDLAAMRGEAIQLAAMAVRFASEVCDDERGRR